MASNGTHGDHVELEALAQAFQIRITTFAYSDTGYLYPTAIIPDVIHARYANYEVCLLNHQVHYQLLRPSRG